MNLSFTPIVKYQQPQTLLKKTNDNINNSDDKKGKLSALKEKHEQTVEVATDLATATVKPFFDLIHKIDKKKTQN